MVPIAHGNDGGGSIRIPAACCGLVGLKPARGRVSVGPDAGQSFLVTDGVLTRDVADTAAVLDVLAGYEPGDATWAPPVAAGAFAAAAAAGGALFGAPLRIGLALNTPLDGADVDPVASRPRVTRRRCCRRWATSSRRSCRRGRGWGCCPTSPAPSGR